jgi:NodT family efflux transporter outer membrane factor (OMF) lipoprotein
MGRNHCPGAKRLRERRTPFGSKNTEGPLKPEEVAGAKKARKRREWVVKGLSLLLPLWIIGCAVGPDFVRPKPPPVERYTHETGPTATLSADGQKQTFELGAKIARDWWRLFNSSKLDGVIKEAMANNPSLQAAQASLRQSQENLRAGYGVFFPQLDGSFDATRQKFSSARFGGGVTSSIFNLYTLTTTISYTLDVFGGQRRTMEGLQAQVDFQHDALMAAYLTLTGNIVNAIVAQAAYSAQIKATEEMITIEEEQVKIAETQAQAGTVPYSNVLSIRSQLAATEATLPSLRQKLSQTEHLLATLVGRTPAEWAPPRVELADLTLPNHLPVTLPSELVHQRPDILGAEAQLHSASANIGVATAALFPSFSLNGTYGLNNNSIENLFRNTSSFWSLGANLTAPLFHGGTLWFKRKAAIEGYEQSLANYRQTVLSAFAQVADTLRALEHDAEALDAQAKALNTSKEALGLLQANYRAGLANYLQILIANAQYDQTRIGYLEALAQRFQDTVALFVALGGGWWDGDGSRVQTEEIWQVQTEKRSIK